jgi:hypothetical protein
MPSKPTAQFNSPERPTMIPLSVEEPRDTIFNAIADPRAVSIIFVIVLIIFIIAVFAFAAYKGR